MRRQDTPYGPRAARPPGRAGALDIHELLKAEAFDGDDQSHFERQRPAPAGSPSGNIVGVSDQYVVLDSFLKLQTSNSAAGEFQWNFMVQGVTSETALGVHDRVDTVLEMQVGQIVMPPLPPLPYLGGAPPPGAPSGMTLLQNNTGTAAPAGGAPAMSYGAAAATGGEGAVPRPLPLVRCPTAAVQPSGGASGICRPAASLRRAPRPSPALPVHPASESGTGVSNSAACA